MVDSTRRCEQDTRCMAYLTQDEFTRMVCLLADQIGLQSLRDRLVRIHALVTRRSVPSADRLAGRLYLLTGGLRRQVPATLGLQSLWTEQVNEALGEDGEKELEKMAEVINGCLDEHEHVIEEKEAELAECLQRYEAQLAASVGAERARLDMLLKAVPDVAEKLRAMPCPSSEN